MINEQENAKSTHFIFYAVYIRGDKLIVGLFFGFDYMLDLACGEILNAYFYFMLSLPALCSYCVNCCLIKERISF
jgi:hypothetical protein